MGKKKNKAINGLIEEIANDSALRKRVRSASLDELAAIANEKGVDVSRGELKKAIKAHGQNVQSLSADAKDDSQAYLRSLAVWSG